MASTSVSASSTARKRWVALESNPSVLTDFGHALGIPREVSFVDVWSVDLLDLVPAPRYAVLLLFPLTEALKTAGDPESFPSSEQGMQATSEHNPLFIRQTIGNACGTIALLHAALQGCITPKKDSVLERLNNDFAGKSPLERADILERAEDVDTVHSVFAAQGQTQPPDLNEKLDLHFVCFVENNGGLFLLDGRRDAPVRVGASTKDGLLKDACDVIKEQFMQKDPSELRFTILALAQTNGDD